LKRALTKLEAKAPEGTGVFLVLHRQAGESPKISIAALRERFGKQNRKQELGNRSFCE